VGALHEVTQFVSSEWSFLFARVKQWCSNTIRAFNGLASHYNAENEVTLVEAL